MAKAMAVLEDGKIANVIWCSDEVQETDELKEVYDKLVRIGDIYDNGEYYDSTVELMTEQNVYGCKVFGNCINGTAWPYNYTVDKSQYPLFTFRPDLISNRQTYWLRDVASSAAFALVASGGNCSLAAASNVHGVRPAFSIKS